MGWLPPLSPAFAMKDGVASLAYARAPHEIAVWTFGAKVACSPTPFKARNPWAARLLRNVASLRQHLRNLVDLFADEGGKLRRRHRHRLHADVANALHHFGILQRRNHRRVELGENVRRNPRRSDKAEPAADFVAFQ